MKSIITIQLNEIGQKAFNAKTRILYSDLIPDNITEKDVYALFPKELIDNYIIDKSFLSLNAGDNVIVVNPDGKREIGTVNGKYGKTITVNMEAGCGYYARQFTFNANGIEATHCKQKHYLDWGTQKEFDYFRALKEKEPYITLLNVLTKDSGNAIQIDEANLVIPEWLTPKLIDELMNTIKCHHEDDDFDY